MFINYNIKEFLKEKKEINNQYYLKYKKDEEILDNLKNIQSPFVYHLIDYEIKENETFFYFNKFDLNLKNYFKIYGFIKDFDFLLNLFLSTIIGLIDWIDNNIKCGSIKLENLIIINKKYFQIFPSYVTETDLEKLILFNKGSHNITHETYFKYNLTKLFKIILKISISEENNWKLFQNLCTNDLWKNLLNLIHDFDNIPNISFFKLLINLNNKKEFGYNKKILRKSKKKNLENLIQRKITFNPNYNYVEINEEKEIIENSINNKLNDNFEEVIKNGKKEIIKVNKNRIKSIQYESKVNDLENGKVIDYDKNKMKSIQYNSNHNKTNLAFKENIGFIEKEDNNDITEKNDFLEINNSFQHKSDFSNNNENNELNNSKVESNYIKKKIENYNPDKMKTLNFNSNYINNKIEDNNEDKMKTIKYESNYINININNDNEKWLQNKNIINNENSNYINYKNEKILPDKMKTINYNSNYIKHEEKINLQNNLLKSNIQENWKKTEKNNLIDSNKFNINQKNSEGIHNKNEKIYQNKNIFKNIHKSNYIINNNENNNKENNKIHKSNIMKEDFKIKNNNFSKNEEIDYYLNKNNDNLKNSENYNFKNFFTIKNDNKNINNLQNQNNLNKNLIMNNKSSENLLKNNNKVKINTSINYFYYTKPSNEFYDSNKDNKNFKLIDQKMNDENHKIKTFVKKSLNVYKIKEYPNQDLIVKLKDLGYFKDN